MIACRVALVLAGGDAMGSYARRSVTLAILAYADQRPEVAGKAMDFSERSARRCWDTGHRDGVALATALGEGKLPIGRAGLHLHHPGIPS